MAKYTIYKDERWPDYSLYPEESGIELSDEFVEKYKRINKEYGFLQEELKKIYEGEE